MVDYLTELKQQIKENRAVLIYFSAKNCSVCEVLKTKIEEAFTIEFSHIKQIYMGENTSKEITSSYGIFSFPTLLIFFEGKEFYRVNQNISVGTFVNDVRRVYEMVFKDDE